jgi:hypothetical protein
MMSQMRYVRFLITELYKKLKQDETTNTNSKRQRKAEEGK